MYGILLSCNLRERVRLDLSKLLDLVEGWDDELPLQQAEGVLEEEDNPLCFQLVENKGQLLFQLVEEGNGVFFFQQVVEGDGILFFQLLVGDDQLCCLEEEGGVDHV